MSRSPITTHILDLERGVPAAGVTVRLERLGDDWDLLGEGRTDDDGRASNLMGDRALEAGTYRLTFAVGPYHEAHLGRAFFPEVSVTFLVAETDRHYHVPLLLSPFGYSTYRGS